MELLFLLLLCMTLISSDHLDGTNIEGTTSDIADFYAFEGENPDSTVFIATIQGNLNPGGVTDNANFDEDVLIEFNIDNTGDLVEDLSYPGYQTWRFNPFFWAGCSKSNRFRKSDYNNYYAQCGANINQF